MSTTLKVTIVVKPRSPEHTILLSKFADILTKQGVRNRLQKSSRGLTIYPVEAPQTEVKMLPVYLVPEIPSELEASYQLHGYELTTATSEGTVTSAIGSYIGERLPPHCVKKNSKHFGDYIASFKSDRGISQALFFHDLQKISVAQCHAMVRNNYILIVREHVCYRQPVEFEWCCPVCKTRRTEQDLTHLTPRGQNCIVPLRLRITRAPVALQHFLPLITAAGERAYCGSTNPLDYSLWCRHIHYGTQIPSYFLPHHSR